MRAVAERCQRHLTDGCLCSSPGAKPMRFAVSSAMWTSAAIASAVIPANIVIARIPIATSVAAAFLAFGDLKAGTPFETASTPVSAVQPDAKARRTRKTTSKPPVSLACLIS